MGIYINEEMVKQIYVTSPEKKKILVISYITVQEPNPFGISENVILGDDNITRDIIIFGYDRDNVLNHSLSIIVYYIYKEWLACSLENKQRKRMICYESFVSHLKIKRNVYSKCEHVIWVDMHKDR